MFQRLAIKALQQWAQKEERKPLVLREGKTKQILIKL